MEGLTTRSKPAAALVGDVIGSRKEPQRLHLQERIADVMDTVNNTVPPEVPLHFTEGGGDEIQGLYGSIYAALTAALRIRLLLAPHAEIRFGIGWGTETFRKSKRLGREGSAWWNAKEALDTIRSFEPRQNYRPEGWRTAFHAGNADYNALVNSFLTCRDAILDSGDAMDLRITLDRLDNKPQKETARTLGITQSAVSQRAKNHGLFAILRSQADLEKLHGPALTSEDGPTATRNRDDSAASTEADPDIEEHLSDSDLSVDEEELETTQAIASDDELP